MIDLDHPFFYLKNIFESESIYTFSKYIYLRDSLLDERILFEVYGCELNDDYISKLILNLNRYQELAFHSIVKTKSGRKFHIPMIDFATNHLNYDTYFRLKYCLDYKILSNMIFFNSGNSFHAYSYKLLTHSEWLKFMGTLLLVNQQGKPNIIDNRWIGHRIIGGYSSLRWSNNSKEYKQIPKKIEFENSKYVWFDRP